MNQPEEFKRKISGLNTYKNTGPLISIPNKQRKKTDISLEKQQRKVSIHERVNTKIVTHYQDQNLKNTQPINFRNLKDTVPRKDTQNKGQMKLARTGNDYYAKNMNPKPMPDAPPHGISINVNIQNMLPKPKENYQHQKNDHSKSDRSLLKEDKSQKRKVKKNLHQIKKIQSFQCNEQINFKWHQNDNKLKLQDKITDKPLIDIKTHRTETQIKSKNIHIEPKELIKKLESEADTINSTAQTEAMLFLDQRQQNYVIPPHYIEKNQKNFTWLMRVILVEWMMHVSYEFSLKRQTFHIAVNLVDLYMSKEHHLPISDFQLVGAAAMFIACKLQQLHPKYSNQFAMATGRYSPQQVKIMEVKICETLSYKLTPPTTYMWANRLMLQWDTYLEMSQYASTHYLFATCQPCYFKRCDQDSIRLFRQIMQYIDCAILHIHTVQYRPKLLACSFLYLVLGVELKVFKKSEIVQKFFDQSRYLLDPNNAFNDLFTAYLQQSMGIILLDLLPTIQYAASYFSLVLSFQEPIIPPAPSIQQNENSEEMNLQQYCSYQTHNPNMTAAIKNRNKDLR